MQNSRGPMAEVTNIRVMQPYSICDICINITLSSFVSLCKVQTANYSSKSHTGTPCYVLFLNDSPHVLLQHTSVTSQQS